MRPIDFLRASLVGVGVLLATLVASVPMVAVYAYVIAPGQTPAAYDAAAQWIAPWSSHLIGPALFFWWNHRGARRVPSRPAVAFALTGIAFYVAADLASVMLFGLTFASTLTATFFISLSVKATGAVLGARLGSMGSPTPSGLQTVTERTDG